MGRVLAAAFGGFQKHVSTIQQEVFMVFLQRCQGTHRSWGGCQHFQTWIASCSVTVNVVELVP